MGNFLEDVLLVISVGVPPVTLGYLFYLGLNGGFMSRRRAANEKNEEQKHPFEGPGP
jgi:hypothetical protein